MRARAYLRERGEQETAQPDCHGNLLFISTMARFAPEITMPWPMTRPRPRAPPVTTPTLPSSEKEASVRFMCRPPRPWTGVLEGSSPSSGYSTVMFSSVRAKEPGAPGFLVVALSDRTRVVCRAADGATKGDVVMVVVGHRGAVGAAAARRARADTRTVVRENIVGTRSICVFGEGMGGKKRVYSSVTGLAPTSWLLRC